MRQTWLPLIGMSFKGLWIFDRLPSHLLPMIPSGMRQAAFGCKPISARAEAVCAFWVRPQCHPMWPKTTAVTRYELLNVLQQIPIGRKASQMMDGILILSKS